MITSNNNLNNVVKEFPGYFSVQVHPENNAIKITSEIEVLFQGMKDNLAIFVSKMNSTKRKIIATDLTNVPSFKMITLPTKAKDLNNHDFINFSLTHGFSKSIQNTLAPILPRNETIGYFFAMRFIESVVLNRTNLNFQPSEILDILKTIGGCVYIATPEQIRGIPKINYRPEVHVVCWDSRYMPKRKEDFKNLDKFVKDHSTPEQYVHWKTARARIWNLQFAAVQQTLTRFTPEEQDLMSSFAYFLPDSNKVPAMCEEFSAEMSKRMATDEDPVSMAAWAHQKITEIHISIDGNGRTARLFMNLILMLKGKKPILMDNDYAYTEAVRSKDPKAFEKYLRALQTKQPVISEFIEKSFRVLFETTCKDTNIDNVITLYRKRTGLN